jgi:hypothetical protein
VRRIGARVSDPHSEAARGHGGKGDAHAQRGKRDRNGRGVLLTTPGCCDDGWRPGIESAGVVSRWRSSSVDGGGSNPRGGAAAQSHGRKRLER